VREGRNTAFDAIRGRKAALTGVPRISGGRVTREKRETGESSREREWREEGGVREIPRPAKKLKSIVGTRRLITYEGVEEKHGFA